jgi:5-oxoprolinase (ATP-hydrolysing) subunit A
MIEGMARVDLNCDAGEGYGPWRMGDDEALLDVVTTVNVACGLHAGDPLIMARTVRLAHQRGVGVGAHPGPNDLWGFGRREVSAESPADLATLVAYQVGALLGIAAQEGAQVTSVKLHGSLSNAAAVDAALAGTLARTLRAVAPSLVWLVPAGSAMVRAAEGTGLRVASEVFADRAYDDHGNLVSRSLPGAVIDDPAECARRAVRMVVDGMIESSSGRKIALRADSVCVHGDTPGAVEAARAVRAALQAAGVEVVPLARVLGPGR